MKLSRYLEVKGLGRREFAVSIGVSAGRITQLCDGSGWPSRGMAEKISAATEGEVTANDFLRLEEVEAAP